MMLVLIGLTTATILATAYLASRDNSAAIGANVIASSSSQWAAVSGLEIGLSVLADNPDWRTNHVQGRLVEDYAFGQALLSIDVLDLETNAPPTAITRHIQLTSTSDVRGITQQATAIAFLSLNSSGRVDIDLSEFAMFAASRISLRHRATLSRWNAAPLSDLGLRLAIGTQGTGAGMINLDDDAAAIDTTAFLGPDASSNIVDAGNSGAIGEKHLLDTIPLPPAPDSGVVETSVETLPAYVLSSGFETIGTDMRWESIELSHGTLRLEGPVTIVSEGDLAMNSQSQLLIDGHVRLVVFGDFVLMNSAIELSHDASLQLFIAGDVEVRNGFIGENRNGSDLRDSSGNATYIDPDRIRIYGIADGHWDVRDNSVVKASIYAPNSEFELSDESALYGRVAAFSILLDDDAAVFYDHRLDEALGFTNAQGSAFDETGHILPIILNQPAIPDGGIITIPDAGDDGEGDPGTDPDPGGADANRGGLVSMDGFSDGLAENDGVDAIGATSSGTVPLTTDIEFTIVNLGGNIATWEASAP